MRRTPFDWSILLLLLMVLVSLYATFSITFSLPKLSGLLFHIAVFYAAVQAATNRKGLNKTLALYLAAGGVIVGVSLVNTQWLFKIPALSQITRQFPVLLKLPGAEQGIHPNQLAGVLLWLLPLAVSLVIGSRRLEAKSEFVFKKPILLWLATVLFLFALVLTQSRGGWIGGIAALLTVAWLWDRRWGWLIGAGALAAFGAAFAAGWQTVGDLLVSDATEAVIGNLGSLGFRQEVWRAGLWGVADFPFTGMGLGAFRQVARVLYPLNVSPAYDIAHAHNIFLQTALDLGLPGLVAYLSLWLGAVYLLWQTLKHTRDYFIKATAIGASGALTGFVVFGISDVIALGAKPGFFLWFLFSFSVSVYCLTFSDTASQ